MIKIDAGCRRAINFRVIVSLLLSLPKSSLQLVVTFSRMLFSIGPGTLLIVFRRREILREIDGLRCRDTNIPDRLLVLQIVDFMQSNIDEHTTYTQNR